MGEYGSRCPLPFIYSNKKLSKNMLIGFIEFRYYVIWTRISYYVTLLLALMKKTSCYLFILIKRINDKKNSKNIES